MTTLLNNEQPSHKGTPEGWNRVLFSAFAEIPQKPEAKRLERILELLVTAQSHLTDVHSALRTDARSQPHFLALNRRRQESELAYHKTLEQLEGALKRYRWRSTISGDLEGFRETLEWHTKAARGDVHWECAIVRILLGLLREPGALARFRKCSNCNHWFYGTTAHQRFCGEVCRRKYVSSSSEFKEKRRIYMREKYRPQQRELEQRSLSVLKKPKNNQSRG